MPFGWAAAGAIGGSLISGYFGSQAAGEAADAQRASSAEAVAENRRQYDQTRADFAPFRETGVRGLQSLADLLGIGSPNAPGAGSLMRPFTPGDLTADPGYQFQLEQGEKAINRQAAARGLRLAPATIQALQRFNQGLASTSYADAFNRDNATKTRQFNFLSGISGTGQASTNALAQVGSNTAGLNAGLITGAGNATAAGIMGSANAWTGAINNGINNFSNLYLTDQYLRGRTPVGGRTGGFSGGDLNV